MLAIISVVIKIQDFKVFLKYTTQIADNQVYIIISYLSHYFAFLTRLILSEVDLVVYFATKFRGLRRTHKSWQNVQTLVSSKDGEGWFK